ncbi:MAG: DUF362 domain-containing protein [Chloroflexi bacterium]|jgi:uncharacterized protein (DUF362 family)|nr:DUF362 domain-containing protein [Chloroflexota bacterium]
MKSLKRRDLLRVVALWSAGSLIAACSPYWKRMQWSFRPTAEAKDVPPSPVPTIEQVVPAEPTVAAQDAVVDPSEIPDVTPIADAGAARAQDAPSSSAPSEAAHLAVAHGASAEQLTQRAIAALGGIERFVKNGHDVIIKPNICNANHGPEYASTTNPEVVATLVRMCLGAGAKRVRVMDSPFSGSPEAAYARSGIEAAVKAAGGEMEIMAAMRYAKTPIPGGQDLKEWPFYQPILEADVVINVPIAKHHYLSTLTLGGKNMMGTIQERGGMHPNIGQRVAEITSVVRPELTVMDATRILMANGPTGGNLNDVKQMNTVIASHDVVAADAYVTRYFDKTPADVPYIRASAEMGLGTMDLDGIKIAEFDV